MAQIETDTNSRYRNLYTSHLANFSGNWTNTSNTGTFYLNVNHTASNSNSNYSRQLTLCINIVAVIALALAKTHDAKRIPS